MGKKLIIPGADFSQNAIALNEIIFKVSANGSAVIQYYSTNNTYSTFGTYSAGDTDEIFGVSVADYVQAMNLKYPYRLFYAQTELEECSITDKNGLLSIMFNWFTDCANIKTIKLKLSGKMKELDNTFRGTSNLETLDGITNIDVSLCDSFKQTFKDAAKIKNLSLNGWDFSNCNTITKFVKLFDGMTALETLDLSNTVLHANIAADVYSSGHAATSGYHFSTNMTHLLKVYVDNVSADDIAYWKSWLDYIGHGYVYTLQTVTEGGVERQALVRNI